MRSPPSAGHLPPVHGLGVADPGPRSMRSQGPMRSWIRSPFRNRRAMAAVLFAATLPVLIGFTALSVDTSIVAVARSQMSTAADAAALAGALKLATENRVRGATDLTTEIGAANTQAVSLATANRVLGAAPVVTSNPSNSSGGQ